MVALYLPLILLTAIAAAQRSSSAFDDLELGDSSADVVTPLRSETTTTTAGVGKIVPTTTSTTSTSTTTSLTHSTASTSFTTSTTSASTTTSSTTSAEPISTTSSTPETSPETTTVTNDMTNIHQVETATVTATATLTDSSATTTTSSSTERTSPSATALAVSTSGTTGACDDFGLTITGGQAPFVIGVFEGNTSTEKWTPLRTLLNETSSTLIDWTINYPPGSELRLGVEDKEGVRVFTDVITVESSTNQSCISTKKAAANSKATSKLSTATTVAIVLSAVLGAILIALVIWAIIRYRKKKQVATIISFEPQPSNTRFEIESDMGDSADYHNVDPDPMTMGELIHDPLTYGMPYPPGNPFSGRSDHPYAIASTLGPYATPYNHGAVVTATRESPLPPLPADTPLSPEAAHTHYSAFGSHAFSSGGVAQGFPTPVRSASVRSDTSYTTRRSSYDKRSSAGLYTVEEEAYHPTMAGIPEDDGPVMHERLPAPAHTAQWRTRDAKYEPGPYGGSNWV